MSRPYRFALIVALALAATVAVSVLPISPLYQPALAMATFLVLSFLLGVGSLSAGLILGVLFLLLGPVLFAVGATDELHWFESIWLSLRAIFSSSRLAIFSLSPLVVALIGYPILKYLFDRKAV